MELEKLLERMWRGDAEARDRLRRLGAEAEPAVPALADAVDKGGRRLRLDAMFVLEGMGPAAAAALDMLLDALRDEEMDVSAQAADTLAALGPVAVPGLGRELRNEDWRVRQAACQALGAMGADAGPAVPALLSLARYDGREEVRQRAVWALGEIGDDSALEPLAAIFTEEGGTVGIWIAEAFTRFGRRARAVARNLRDELHRDDPLLAIAAAAALLEIGEHTDAAIWALITCLQGPEEDLRIEAAMTLGDFGPAAATAIPALRAAERDESEEVRAQASLAIAKIRPEFARVPATGRPA